MEAMTEERIAFRASLRQWVEDMLPKQRALELERVEDAYPYEIWDRLTDAGLHGVGIPEEFGGSGGDPVDSAIVARELARNLGGLAWVWAISSFAGARAILTAGSPEQQRSLLPRLAGGELRFAIAATEPGGGTDLLGGMRTRAVRRGDTWTINGQKMWSTGANEADMLLLLARTAPAEDGARHRGTTLFLVPRTSPGIECRYIPKIGMRAVGSCEVFLDDVVIGDEAVLGAVDHGFKAMVGSLNNERVLTAALALGMMDGILEEAVDYATQREAFGKVIGAHQAVQHKIADIAIWRKQAELLAQDVAAREAAGALTTQDALIAKVACSEHAVRAADTGIQVLGGMGLSQETHMQRYWRDLRQFMIAPISNEMARNGIGESLGMPRSY